MRNKVKKTINAGVVDRGWEYHPNRRLEGLLQASKYLEWKNLNENNIFKERLKKEGRFSNKK